MKSKKKLACVTACVAAFALLFTFCGLWNAYMKDYCEPMVFYPMENGRGIYADLPDYAPYYTQLGTYSYLTTGDNLDALNEVCSAASDDYRKFHAYDVSNLFRGSADGKDAVCFFADTDAVKYLGRHLSGGVNVDPEAADVQVLAGGRKNEKVRPGDRMEVEVRDKRNKTVRISCTVAGKIDGKTPLPADAGFTPDSYRLQQESLIILPHRVKDDRGLEYDNRFLVRIVNTTEKRPEGHKFKNVRDIFEPEGYRDLPKKNSAKMAETSAYFRFALTKATLSAGGMNAGQICIAVGLVLTAVCCAGGPVLIWKNERRVSRLFAILSAAGTFAFCSLSFVITRYGCGYGLLSYGGFIAWPLIFTGVYLISSALTDAVKSRKNRIEEVYVSGEEEE